MGTSDDFKFKHDIRSFHLMEWLWHGSSHLSLQDRLVLFGCFFSNRTHSHLPRDIWSSYENLTPYESEDTCAH